MNLPQVVFVAPRASSPVRPNIEGRAEVVVIRAGVALWDRYTPVSRIQIWDWSLRVVAAAARLAALGLGRSY